MSLIPKLRRIRSKEEYDLALKLAKEDNDGVMLPTHVVEKNGEIVGAASLNLVPVVMLWHSSTKVGARDSLMLKPQYDALMEERTGGKTYAILCNKNSPYNPAMKSLGYQSVWETEVFIGGS